MQVRGYLAPRVARARPVVEVATDLGSRDAQIPRDALPVGAVDRSIVIERALPLVKGVRRHLDAGSELAGDLADGARQRFTCSNRSNRAGHSVRAQIATRGDSHLKSERFECGDRLVSVFGCVQRQLSPGIPGEGALDESLVGFHRLRQVEMADPLDRADRHDRVLERDRNPHRKRTRNSVERFLHRDETTPTTIASGGRDDRL